MSDATIFAIVFVTIFVLRIVAATLVFYWILPQNDRCPNCNAITLRMQPRGLGRWMPWFRSSWCMDCGWSGILRHGPGSTTPAATVPRSPHRHRSAT
jgi:hypothetical protein